MVVFPGWIFWNQKFEFSSTNRPAAIRFSNKSPVETFTEFPWVGRARIFFVNSKHCAVQVSCITLWLFRTENVQEGQGGSFWICCIYVDVLMVHMKLDILLLDVYRTFGLLHVVFQDMASSAKDYWRQMSLKAARLTIDHLCLYLQSTKYHNKSHRELSITLEPPIELR